MPLPPARIGLSAYREQATYGVWSQQVDLLPGEYADSVADAGGLPLLLPAVDAALAPAAIAGLDGLILTGGPDVDPGRYGAERHPRTASPRTGRDSWEIALTAAALECGIPVLGVCRGMQLLAVALGGSLTQHLPDLVGTALHSPTPGGFGHHDVRLAAGSRLAAVLGERLDVATHHHQAVDRLPAAVTAVGWADDGTVEAFEGAADRWLVGVQWHPEVHDGAALFGAFIEAALAPSPDLAPASP